MDPGILKPLKLFPNQMSLFEVQPLADPGAVKRSDSDPFKGLQWRWKVRFQALGLDVDLYGIVWGSPQHRNMEMLAWQ